MNNQSKLKLAQSAVIGALKNVLGDDAHLLDRLIATRGKNKGFLKSTPPKCGTDEEPLYLALISEANPHLLSIGRLFFLRDEQRIKFNTWEKTFRDIKAIRYLCKNRVTLDMLGVY
jgi:hypothetical protein